MKWKAAFLAKTAGLTRIQAGKPAKAAQWTHLGCFFAPKSWNFAPDFLQGAIIAQMAQRQSFGVYLYGIYEFFMRCPKTHPQKCKTGMQIWTQKRQICIFSKLKLANEILIVRKMQVTMHLSKLKLAFLTPNLRSKCRKWIMHRARLQNAKLKMHGFERGWK